MHAFDALMAGFARLSFVEQAASAVVWNMAIFVLSLLAGHQLMSRFAARSVAPLAPAATRREWTLAVACVALNTLVSWVGIALWRSHIIQLRPSTLRHTLVDTLVLVIAMDLAMYVTHRFAHIPLFYELVHGIHHDYPSPRPLTLFVLHPLEVLGFGALLLVVLCLYPTSAAGLTLYLILNVAFGVVGHLGVELVPAGYLRWPLLRFISTSTFHAQHHRDGSTHFGFYTLLWDRAFGTMNPVYETELRQATEGGAPHEWKR